MPVVVKDNIATLGLPTTCASKILEGYVSPYEATAVARLREAGAVIVGKTNMDEFAMGSSTENSAYGPTRNPLDARRVPGGSSGGSAAAVAAGIVRVALGSETGGSVRQPAAFCGIVGVKPTYGRVSRYGLVAFASSLDQIGVFGAASTTRRSRWRSSPATTRSTRRARAKSRARLSRSVERDARHCTGVVVGVPQEYFPDVARSGDSRALRRALDQLRELGAEVRDVSLPHTEPARFRSYYIVAPAEASSNLARFDGVRYGLRVDGGRAARHVRGDALAAASAPRSRAASCSARTCSPPATTTRTTGRRRRCAR